MLFAGSERLSRSGLRRCKHVINVAGANGEGDMISKRHAAMAFGAAFGRGGGRAEPPPPADDAVAYITGALPDDWFTGAPDITIDRDEILIVGTLPAPGLAEDASDADRAAAEQGRIASYREDTRERRIRIAQQLEHRY